MRKTPLWAAIVVAVAFLVGAADANAAPHPTDCPSGNVLMGAQDWYPDDIVHMHLDVCAPIYQTVSGTIQMKAWRTKHNLQGTSDVLYRRGRDASGIFDQPALSHPNFWTPSTGTYVQEFTLPYDTRRARWNGWFEMVPQQKNKDAPCEGDRLAIMDIPVFAQNGKTRKDRDPVTPGAAGFCSAFYSTVSLLTPIPVTSPAQPQQMPFTVDVQFSDAVCSSKTACSESGPVTSYSVHLDPAFHGGHHGTILAAGTGTNPRVQFQVDPLAIPGTGWHNLVMKGVQPIPTRGTKNSGLFNFWFYDGA